MSRSHQPLDRFRIANARRLRSNATPAERRLWRHLPRIPVVGTHFRRQVPIGPYFADFVCHQIGLVIELDGSQHANEPDRRHDDARTAFMEAAGYEVIRFWNHEVLEHLDAVLHTIFAVVQRRQSLLAERSEIHP